MLCCSLWCLVHSYLVYQSFSPVGIIGPKSLVIAFPDARRFKAQMVAPNIGVRAMVPLTLDVTQHSKMSLYNPEGCLGSVTVEVV